jgi:hypothetical protein
MGESFPDFSGFPDFLGALGKLYLTTIYDHDLQLSFQKNEPTVQPTIGIDVFH